MSVELRPYDATTDADALYGLKTAFERGLGENTGGDDKAAAYDGKLTADYREKWLAWVDRCVADEPRCVTVAVDGTDGDDGEAAVSVAGSGPDLVGYVFCLPEQLAFIWDAAVINELYLAPEYRGTGVADELMNAVVDLAADQDLPLDRIVLDVDPKNERARAFYDRHGFEPWGEMVARQVGDASAD
ncbi:GNAT family N-acetyltransferase [Halorubrum sp. 48-1-W]|uniref:GNAT family N-acetyltransferase n=1 Tax=Halorubrum sp. 48-1-W TaxID=2249761 RepID=UPI000DCD74B8|nr:GNAT family N-acetyltransferase [Halorubrum sp. 48-1-W]RAW43980.1 GNAT family N-acetyltransferase [Halorubrum sp. 48-1-W]